MTELHDSQTDDELVFVPLGGTGEIGMNLNLYGLDGKWIMLDLGVTFGEDGLPGVDVVMPDPTFIEDRHSDLLAIVLTHGHEDHLGAVQYLWPRFRCPVYASPFAAALLRRKLAEVGLEDEVELHEVPIGGRFELGPFDLEFVTVTHSILEPNAVAVRTRYGTVLHTGDFKIETAPPVGDATDVDKLKALGDAGVLAMVCDSTNVLQKGNSGQEADLCDSLDALVADRTGRVLVTTFASNATRVNTVARIAARHGRHLALVGRSLWRIVEAAREAGYLRDLPPLLSDADIGYLPRDKVLILATGSQGEPRAALAKIAAEDHPNVTLEAGDVVVFSSKIIPGNGKPIYRMINRLMKRGIEVVTERDAFVHVSGHPARDELAQYYDWVRPSTVIPVHGEARHLREHVSFSRSCGVPHAVLAENGDVIRLAPGPIEIVDSVPTGRLALDGNMLLPIDSDVLRERRRLMREGVLFVTLVMDESGDLLADPKWRAQGVLIDGEIPEGGLAEMVRGNLKALSASKRRDDEVVRETARLAVRRELRRVYDKRPTVTVELVRI